LVEALHRVKAGGSTIVVITHRVKVLRCVDMMLVMKEGQAVNFGPRDQVLEALAGESRQRSAGP
jgi:ABC-type protease/lipase transport system fused ATPase/permease subunit